MEENYDFSGYVTRNDLLCGDGRTIRKNAFKDCDGKDVPLVYNHEHDDPTMVLGHAMLENRDDGVYAYAKFNDTDMGKHCKELVKHGDVRSLSIWANQLKQVGNDVIHGVIREVSLVLGGANPGAFIDTVLAHDGVEQDGLILGYDENIMIYHSADSAESEKGKEDVDNKEEKKSDNKTIGEIIDTMTEEQKNAMYAVVGQAINDAKNGSIEDDEDSDKGANKEMKHNVFDNDDNNEEVLAHSAIIADSIKDAKRYGSMKESFLAHAAANNIENIDYLFPEPTELNVPPKFIKEDESWVAKVMGSVKHTPFSRVRTTFATMTAEEARAKGYIKGNMKTETVLSLLRRSTVPTTVYIKQKIDRDDVVDITDFDVVAWQKTEMRNLLDKELARAMLLGDGRLASSEDKINEQCIRPVISDDDLYTIKYTITEGVDYKNTSTSASDNDSLYKGVIRGAIKSRKQYKGSGRPTFFTTEDLLTDLLLIEDQNGRIIYDSIEKLATAMRVKEIVTIPEMENYTDIYGIIVNMNDYTAGADKGGSVNVFDDFDIDYNQMKYLMETRMSGALVVPYSAIVLQKESTSTADDTTGTTDTTAA